MRKAIEKLDQNRFEEALKDLEYMLKELNDLNRPELVKDAVSAINSVIENIRRVHGTRGRKSPAIDPIPSDTEVRKNTGQARNRIVLPLKKKIDKPVTKVKY